MDSTQNATTFTQMLEANLTQSVIGSSGLLNSAAMEKKIEAKGAAIGELYDKKNNFKYWTKLQEIIEIKAKQQEELLREALKDKKISENYCQEMMEKYISILFTFKKVRLKNLLDLIP